MAQPPPSKRMRLDTPEVNPATVRASRAAFLDSLARSISPPLSSSTATRPIIQQQSRDKHSSSKTASIDNEVETNGVTSTDKESKLDTTDSVFNIVPATTTLTIPSPIQLTRVRDLPATENVDTVTLNDILGDPLIKEAWIFNFCFDVDWLMQHFDADVREMVDVKIVHGSWRKEDGNKIQIDEACARWPNVKAITAYLPDAFGTHHSKMFVLFRHDDQAQVIIHTANMLAKDWTNMTQAVWRSPLLPISMVNSNSQPGGDTLGIRFKRDLVRYLQAYQKLSPLVKQIHLYDFKEVKAAIVASVPSKFKISASSDEVWGYEMLRRKLQDSQIQSDPPTAKPHFVFQVSSIASLATNWLKETLYSTCGSTQESTSIIFPTAPDVAASLDGYSAGGSIHTKAQSNLHLQQISRLRPQLSRWTAGPANGGRSGRHLAAPHIKTYIRFSSQPTASNIAPDIDWALVTSANLSTQAWGSSPKPPKGVKDANEAIIHIQSYEIGVLVWPGAFVDQEQKVPVEHRQRIRMIPCFRKNTPDGRNLQTGTMVGLRMPYDLPLISYTEDEMPWSPRSSYATPDRYGQVWL